MIIKQNGTHYIMLEHFISKHPTYGIDLLVSTHSGIRAMALEREVVLGVRGVHILNSHTTLNAA